MSCSPISWQLSRAVARRPLDTLPKRSLHVPHTFHGRGFRHADAQAARASSLHRQASFRERRLALVRGDEGGAGPQIEERGAPADLGARGARLHPAAAQPGARARSAEGARDEGGGAREHQHADPGAARPPTMRSSICRCTAGSRPARRSRRCRAPTPSPSPPPCSARASIMRWRSPAIRWSRKAFSTAIMR